MTFYKIDCPLARDACTAFFEALLELHSATCRREHLGDVAKPHWDATMTRVLAATEVVLRAAAINPADEVAVARYFAKQARLRELRTGKTLQQEAIDALQQSEMRR